MKSFNAKCKQNKHVTKSIDGVPAVSVSVYLVDRIGPATWLQQRWQNRHIISTDRPTDRPKDKTLLVCASLSLYPLCNATIKRIAQQVHIRQRNSCGQTDFFLSFLFFSLSSSSADPWTGQAKNKKTTTKESSTVSCGDLNCFTWTITFICS